MIFYWCELFLELSVWAIPYKRCRHIKDYCQRVRVQILCLVLQVLYGASIAIIEGGEACSRYLYDGVKYDIFMYLMYESYMVDLLATLAANRKYLGIST